MAGHDAIGVTETAHGITVAVEHFCELTVAVVVVLDQGFDSLIVDDALDRGQACRHFVVMQVHADPARRADVGQRALFGAGEMQEVTECVFDTIQRNRFVVVRHFAEVEEDVVQRLQQVVTTLRADQIDLFVRVVDALARRYVHERNGAALVIRKVEEAAALAQALLPRQHPAFAEHAVDIQIAGVKTRPFDGHQARQAEVDFIRDQLAASRGVDRIAAQAADGTAHHRLNHVATAHFAGDETCGELHGAGQHGFHACLRSGLEQLCNTTCRTRHGHQYIDGSAQPAWNFVVHWQIAIPAAADKYVVGAAGDGRATGQLIAFARRRHTVDEDVGRTLGNLDRPRMLVTGTNAFFNMRCLAVVDVHIG
ncbi:hypothetical protein ALP03_05884 [Pseudomonas amygdali pv. tabaci]|uniref:Uncharacterized protein n=1 Tax=Pseudomonas amygdali pv. tabaci TaxID=322 RepID=A0A3M6HQI3_PSEAJ|nr:hypothetical protein ALP03_05884 [Pseudomonas amygdali pv. tabaci]